MTLTELKLKCIKMLEMQQEEISSENIEEATNYADVEYNALESINRCIALRLIEEKKLYLPNFRGIEYLTNSNDEIQSIPYNILVIIPYFVAGELGLEDEPSRAAFNTNKFESYLTKLPNAPEYSIENKMYNIYEGLY